MSTSSFPAAACRRTGRAGSPASPASSCPCACCRACSAASFSKASPRCNQAGRLAFFGDLAPLADKRAFDAALAPLRRSEWVVYAKRPFAGPQAVLAYLARYTHRVAISNSRLIALDEAGVTFKWKDYRIKGRDRLKTMTLDAAEFIRRFLLHVLPSGFHRIRHYGLFAGAVRARNIERVRQLLAAPKASPERARRGRQRDRNTFACAPMPLLRRPDDHRRNLRRRAPCALAIADPDQDRHLMTVAALPASQRRFAFASSRAPEQETRCPHDVRRPSPSAAPTPRRSHPRPRKSPSSSLPPTTPRAIRPRRHTRDPSATSKSP